MSKQLKRKGVDNVLHEFTQNKVILLSTLGSAASIAALIITLMDRIAFERQLPPELAAWRFILMLICLVCIAASALVSYHWTLSTYNDETRPFHTRILWITIQLVVGLFLIGIFLDGFYAALYWQVWLYGVVQSLIEMRRLF